MATLKNLPASVLAHRAGTGRNIGWVPPVVYTSIVLVSNVFFASSSLLFYFLHLASPPCSSRSTSRCSHSTPVLYHRARVRRRRTGAKPFSLLPTLSLPPAHPL